jgi:hypothetical protein
MAKTKSGASRLAGDRRASSTQGKGSVKKNTLRFGRGFKVAVGNRRVQAAQMVIAPGDCEGGPENRHSLVLIEHGERHEIRNTGRQPLKTLPRTGTSYRGLGLKG